MKAPAIEICSRCGWRSVFYRNCTRGDVIVIDHASFHRSQVIDEIVAAAGCEVWYLPTYSPDLNKIEHWWFVLKNWMRQRWEEFDSDARLCRCCIQTLS